MNRGASVCRRPFRSHVLMALRCSPMRRWGGLMRVVGRIAGRNVGPNVRRTIARIVGRTIGRNVWPVIALFVVLSGVGGGGVAWAHHAPGHAASESVRNLSTLGVGAAAVQTRVMVFEEVSWTSTGFNPGMVSTTSLLGEVTVHPWVSVGLVAPVVVAKTADASARVGYGDTRFMLRVTPHADKLVHRVVTAGVNVSVPTRSIRFVVDPGPIVSVAPYVLFTRTYGRPFWQVAALSTLEHRPAGLAWDVHASFQAGIRTRVGFMATLGALADLRALNVCAVPRGRDVVCKGSRATEIEREIGSLRVAQSYGVAWQFRRDLMVSALLVVPMTRRRDFDVLATVGVQASF